MNGLLIPKARLANPTHVRKFGTIGRPRLFFGFDFTNIQPADCSFFISCAPIGTSRTPSKAICARIYPRRLLLKRTMQWRKFLHNILGRIFDDFDVNPISMKISPLPLTAFCVGKFILSIPCFWRRIPESALRNSKPPPCGFRSIHADAARAACLRILS